MMCHDLPRFSPRFADSLVQRLVTSSVPAARCHTTLADFDAALAVLARTELCRAPNVIAEVCASHALA